MHIDIQATGFHVSTEMKRSITKRVNHSFRYNKRKVRKVIVRLFKTVGHKGKSIKSCRIQAITIGMPQLITEKRSDNMFEAVNSAISMSSRSVSKYLHKLRKLRHIKTQIADRRFA